MKKLAPIWNLRDLYNGLNDPKIESDSLKVERLVKSLIKRKDVFKQKKISSEKLLKIIKDFELVELLVLNLFAFFQIQYDIDSSNQEIASKLDKIKKLIVKVGADLAFLDIELAKLDKKLLNKLAEKPEFSPYKHYLKRKKDLEKHLLSEAEEKILTLCSLSGELAWEHFYSEMVTNLDFGTIKYKGKEIKASDNILTGEMFNPIRARREFAYKRLKGTFGKQISQFAFIYRTVVNDYQQRIVKLRKYKTGLAKRCINEEVREKQVLKMLAIINDNRKIYQNYYKIKQKKLKLKQLYNYDNYAPLHNISQKFDFSQAKKDILDCLANFDKDLARVGEKFFKKNWIHARLQGKKYSGAYCFPLYHHPYLLINFQPTYFQTFVLSHELGHGVHNYISAKNQSFLQMHASLSLAECASQFNELLLLDYYSQKLKNRKLFENILANQIDDILNAIFKQSLITRFEIKAHDISTKQGLTADYLSNLWLNMHENLAGKVIKVNELEKYGWARISHIFQQPFYCFNYSLSMFVVLALYNLYIEDGKAFVNGYKKLLQAGLSDSPRNLLKKTLGLDIYDDNFYHQGLKVIKKRINDFK